MSHKTQKQRIRWQCLRGMLELDLYFLPFLDDKYDELTPIQQSNFSKLLQTEDECLYRWLIDTNSIPNVEFKQLIDLIKEHATHTY